MDSNIERAPTSGLEPILGVAMALFGLAVVVAISGSPTLGTEFRLGLVPAGAVIAGYLVSRTRDRRDNSRRDTALSDAINEIHIKSKLLSGVAHEIQDPLTSLLGLSELLRDNHSLSAEEMREFIGLMHGEATDLAMLAEDLYVVSASTHDGMAGHGRTAVDLLLETERAAGSLKGRERTVTVRGKELVATTSLPRLRHVLRSLLANIERFGGSTVEIVVEERNGAPTVILSDDGPPLDDEAVAGTDGSTGRTGRSGLRFAIAAMMAASFGGRLDYERSPGWTNFVLTLDDGWSADDRRHATAARTVRLGRIG
jgi:signal transduction histidine kinase